MNEVMEKVVDDAIVEAINSQDVKKNFTVGEIIGLVVGITAAILIRKNMKIIKNKKER